MQATLLLFEQVSFLAEGGPVRLGTMCRYDSCMNGPVIEIAWLGLLVFAPLVVRRWYDTILAAAAVVLTLETFSMFARTFESGLAYAMPHQLMLLSPLSYLEWLAAKFVLSLMAILATFVVAWLTRRLTYRILDSRHKISNTEAR